MIAKRNIFNLPIIIRKNHIWMSELLGMFVGIVIAVVLIAMGWIAILNDRKIQQYNTVMPLIKNERVVVSHTLNELKQKFTIVAVLNTFSHGKLSDDIKWILAELVYRNSKTYGYDPLLLLAVIHVESLFDPKAKGQFRNGNYSGALGLMQLKTETAQHVAEALGIPFKSKEDLFIPEVNIPLGIAYLTQQISHFKSLKLGILAYNQGPGIIASSLKNKRPLSIRYYNKVLKSYFSLKKMHDNT